MRFSTHAFLSLLAGSLLLTGCNVETPETETSQTETPKPTQTTQTTLWQIDYDAARKQAAAENKYLLVSISGLDWCHWCIQLEEEVFSKPEFVSYARKNLVPVLLDFNSYGKPSAAEFSEQHEQLLRSFGIQGFPTVLILNPQGDIVHRTGYQPGGAETYVTMIQDIIATDQAR